MLGCVQSGYHTFLTPRHLMGEGAGHTGVIQGESEDGGGEEVGGRELMDVREALLHAPLAAGGVGGA